MKIAERVIGLVKERVTDKILQQSLGRYGTAEKHAQELSRLSRRLSEYLA